ncbi:hypothetical protein [Thaumasiovibrio sp. DFM-14]|uniref:hypothetical protein n=1 Tax=Thaumasiovibrio sp. DFM-14 TaxID=3384792 RepID=UPI0039A3B0E7
MYTTNLTTPIVDPDRLSAAIMAELTKQQRSVNRNLLLVSDPELMDVVFKAAAELQLKLVGMTCVREKVPNKE